MKTNLSSELSWLSSHPPSVQQRARFEQARRDAQAAHADPYARHTSTDAHRREAVRLAHAASDASYWTAAASAAAAAARPTASRAISSYPRAAHEQTGGSYKTSGAATSSSVSFAPPPPRAASSVNFPASSGVGSSVGSGIGSIWSGGGVSRPPASTGVSAAPPKSIAAPMQATINFDDYADCFDDDDEPSMNFSGAAAATTHPAQTFPASARTQGGDTAGASDKWRTSAPGYSSSIASSVAPSITPAAAAPSMGPPPPHSSMMNRAAPTASATYSTAGKDNFITPFVPQQSSAAHPYPSSSLPPHPSRPLLSGPTSSSPVPKPVDWSIQSAAVVSEWCGPYPWDTMVSQLNEEVFGNLNFRLHQREAINAIMSKRDVFVLMPTGAGKTLIYALYSLVAGGLTVVFSPLISLIQDQVDTLTQQGLPARALTSATEMEDVRRVWDEVFAGQTRLLYITPERFKASAALGNKLQSLHNRGALSAFVIDEGQRRWNGEATEVGQRRSLIVTHSFTHMSLSSA